MIIPEHWQHRVGNQRDWIWRGWQTRYTYIRPPRLLPHTKPIILLHGFGTSIGHWRQNLGVLSEVHTVYAIDLLGFGASEKALLSYKVALWVEQVYEFWRTLIRHPVVLVGNSIGSLVALAAAAKHPEMVQGVVMLSLPDPSLEAEAIPRPLQPIVAAIKSLVASPLVLKAVFRLVNRPTMIRRWAAIAYANPESVSDELVDILLGPAQDRGSAQAFYGTIKAITNAESGLGVKALLPEVKVPMLLIWGQQDRMVPPALARQFVKYNPNLQLLSIENAGHCPHDECPEQVNPEILNWMEYLDLQNSGADT